MTETPGKTPATWIPTGAPVEPAAPIDADVAATAGLPVVLVGAGDLGAEVLAVHEALSAWPDRLAPPAVAGYVDDAPGRAGASVGGLPVLGPVEWLRGRGGKFAALIAVGDPAVRAALRQRLEAMDLGLATWIHPGAAMARSVVFGEGCVVMAATSFTVDARLGRNVVVNPGSTVAHHARIGDDAVICPGVHLAGRVIVEAGAFLGTGAVVAPGRRIGAGAVVGAGASVVQDVQPGAKVGGVPARPL